MAADRPRVYTMGTDEYHKEFMRAWNDERWELITAAVREHLQAELGRRDADKKIREYFDADKVAERRQLVTRAIVLDYPAAVADRVLWLCEHVAESFLAGGDFYNNFLEFMSAYIVNTECRGLYVKWVYDPKWTVKANPDFTGERLFDINSDPSIAAAIKAELIAEDMRAARAADNPLPPRKLH